MKIFRVFGILWKLSWSLISDSSFDTRFTGPLSEEAINQLKDDEKTRMDAFIGKLQDARKAVSKKLTRELLIFVTVILLYWGYRFKQIEDVSVMAIKIKSLEPLLPLFPLYLSSTLYQLIVGIVHRVAIDKVVDSYYKRFLPSVYARHLQVLLEDGSTEFVLSKIGMISFFPGIFSTVFIGFVLFALGFITIATTLASSIINADFQRWGLAKLAVIGLSIYFLLRGVFIFVGCMVRETRRLKRTRSNTTITKEPKPSVAAQEGV